MNDTTLTAEARARIERACERVVLESAMHNDLNRVDAFVALFAAEGVLHRPDGVALRGRDAIAAAYRARPAARLLRHLCSNVLIDVHSPTSAGGRCSVLVLAADADDADPVYGARCEPRMMVGEFLDTFVQTPAGWLIAERRARFAMHAIMDLRAPG